MVNSITTKMSGTEFAMYGCYIECVYFLLGLIRDWSCACMPNSPQLSAAEAHKVYYGNSTTKRLQAIKSRLDPYNTFDFPQAIGHWSHAAIIFLKRTASLFSLHRGLHLHLWNVNCDLLAHFSYRNLSTLQFDQNILFCASPAIRRFIMMIRLVPSVMLAQSHSSHSTWMSIAEQ